MDKSKKKKITIVVVTTIVLIVILGLYLGLPVDKRYNDIIFGGLNMQTVINTNIINQKDVGNKLINEVKKVDKLVNPTMETSDIYKINHSLANEPVKVDNLTIKLLEISYDVYKKTDGLYNPASYTLVDMWSFSAEKFNVNNPPTKEPENIDFGIELANKFDKIRFVDSTTTTEQLEQYKLDATFLVDKVAGTITRTSNCFVVNPNSTTEKVGAMIDLGGIAKGYAAELCYNVFKLSKSKNGLVNIGGNVYSYNKDWRVGIENPFKNQPLPNNEVETSIFGVVTLNNLSVSVSGVYERNYKIEDKFYHHIINTTTGRPQDVTSDNAIVSAGVIGKNGAICDAVATSFVLMGTVDKVEEFIANNYTDEIQAVILITKDKHYKILGKIPFELNETELVGFEKIQ